MNADANFMSSHAMYSADVECMSRVDIDLKIHVKCMLRLHVDVTVHIDVAYRGYMSVSK